MAFIDANRHEVFDSRELGVEPICTVLRDAGVQVAASTCCAIKTRPSPVGACGPALRRLRMENYCVYGAGKLWKAARRTGYNVGCDQVARLMRAKGIEGARRTKRAHHAAG